MRLREGGSQSWWLSSGGYKQYQKLYGRVVELIDARDLKSIGQFVCASSILFTDSICWLYANGKQIGCDPVDVGSIPSSQPNGSLFQW